MQRSFKMHEYDSILEFFSTLSKLKGFRFGLECITSMCDALNNPQKAFSAVHIAGTNGKGSCAYKIAKALDCESYTVGLFTSPHISSIRERIQINGKMISKEEFSRIFYIVHQAALEYELEATYFEYCTCIAYLFFKERNVDFAVLETGLGGRLDATNVCYPIVTVITSISLDHTNILGNTREQIALEKAGIIKRNVPCVIGPHVPSDVIEKVAKENNATLFKVFCEDRDFDRENSEIARKSLEVLSQKILLSKESIEKGISEVPPLRFEVIHKPSCFAIVCDVGHNPDGVKRLFEKVKQKFGSKKITTLCGMSKEKDVRSCLQYIVDTSNTICFIQANSERAIAAQKLLEIANEIDSNTEKAAFSEIEKGFFWAIDHTDQDSVLCIFGSFFIMSDIQKLLAIDQERDKNIVQEQFINNS